MLICKQIIFKKAVGQKNKKKYEVLLSYMSSGSDLLSVTLKRVSCRTNTQCKWTHT